MFYDRVMERPEIVITDEAYKWESGPVLLLAGPGTGKTYQLAKRIQYLTSNGVSPDEITAITFTQEAAKSMRAKLSKKGSQEYVDYDKRPGRISTMHSLGHFLIEENALLVGLKKGFSVVESQEIRKLLIRDAALLLELTEKDAEVAYQDRTKANRKPHETSKAIVDKYEEILRACNAVDYDDQIALACKILRENSHLKKKYSLNTKHLLVDEYQDINPDQFELIRLLSEDHTKGLFVVGDDDQSIYSFRGGSPAYIRNFHKHFGKACSVLQMQTSRRCRQKILDSAVSVVVKHDLERLDKGSYKYTQSDPGTVTVHNCPSDDREADILYAILKDDIDRFVERGGEAGARTAFILVPTRLYSQKIYSKLRKLGTKISVQGPDDGAGWASFLAVRRWAEQEERQSLEARRCIEVLIEGGTTTIPTSRARKDTVKRAAGMKKIANLWLSVLTNGKDLETVLIEAGKEDLECKEIADKLEELRISYKSTKVHDFFEKVTGLTKTWSSTDKFFEDLDRSMQRGQASPATSVDNYEIRILTMQSSKGLEAELVFVVGVEEGAIPREAEDGDVAEEARLFFVAMTRAKEHLHLMSCRKRTGATTFRPIPHGLKKSRFLDTLPKETFHPPKK